MYRGRSSSSSGPKILQLGLQGCFPGAAQEHAGVSRDYLRSLSTLVKMSKPRGRYLKNRVPGGQLCSFGGHFRSWLQVGESGGQLGANQVEERERR